MKLKRNLNEVVRTRRKEMGLTLEKLAEMCEMSDKGIEKIEIGKSDPKWTNVLKIANILKIDLGMFCDFDDEEASGETDNDTAT